MSGGMFNYLHRWENDRAGDLREMAAALREYRFDHAAAETESFAREPSAELRAVWKAVEWFQSADWGFEPILEAIEVYEAKAGSSRPSDLFPPDDPSNGGNCSPWWRFWR